MAGVPDPAADLTFDHVVDLLRILDGSDLPTTIEFRNGPLRIRIERGVRTTPGPGPAPVPAAPPGASPPPAPVAPSAEPDRPVPPPTVNGDGAAVPAPVAGVFYRAPRPDADPFVEVGARVDADDVVGIVEVMKLMNTVRAGVSGVVTAIHARNAELVEFGETLMRIRPDGPGP